jgi:ATP-dependent Clp protease ATP-binding subunit ClpC
MPLLVGEQGVGKRGLLEDLADRMVAGEVPAELKDKRLVNLILPKLVSGANPSEAAERILRVLNEASRSGNIVLAISGVHGVRGISSGQAGSVDLAEVLATGVRRLRIKVIATTTPEANRQYLVGSALGGLFESVLLTEPTVEEAIPMVESHALLTELSHGVFFTYDAIERLVDLTSRFLPDKRLPKKAIDLLDELALYMKETRQKKKVIRSGDVDSFLSSKIDMPLRDVSHDESSLLLNFEDRIHERFINQEQAVSVVADALRRARAEIRDTKRPIVNLLFLGPTGVGKTELAKTVAALYFGDEKRMVRIDMSEYVGAESVERLTGGRATTYGILTEAVRAHPFSLVLLDELEKADTRVLNLFLQILDDGRVTAGNGEVIDFTNTIIIATSNAGTEYIQDAVRRGDEMGEIEKTLHETVLRKNFAPEFINRFDAVVVFKPLTLPHVSAIASLLLKIVAKRMEVHGVSCGDRRISCRRI